MSLSSTFLAEIAEPLRGALAADARLEEALREAIAAGRAAWPGVELGDEGYLRHLAEKVAATPPAAGAPPLAHLRATDLWLACACISGGAVALALFDARYRPDIVAALRHMNVAASTIDEVEQVVRDTLFVTRAQAGARPRIADYGGRGDLRKWVRSTALRAAIKLITRGDRGVQLDDEALAAMPAPADDPELAYLKGLYRAEFKAAFEKALSELSERDRLLLRQSVLDGLTVDELGTLYRVHRATAARWVARVRGDLLEGTRRALQDKLRLGETELASVMRLARSQLDVSLERLLPGDDEDE